MAECHREAVAGRGAVAAEMLQAGALLSRTVLAEKPQGCIGKMLLAEKPHSSIGKQLPLRRSLYNSIGKH